ncbi:dihydropteroate synthase [Clostridium hydrogeniformans]|uniref:dihydropteroate synthase n=1 Tax=Clostridium hydrogeniformans TaxID=349933 RepID=UPI000555F328|nr:dihydropteroate synthase [Clostridium hydrogeniformans]
MFRGNRVLKIGNKNFNLGERTYIMGILNVTPDSFSDGGKYNSIEKALKHTREMIKNGVDIIDIGGESTRPNHDFVDAEEEVKRVVPVIKALRKEFKDIPISIDTYKAMVAEEALKAGANMINDVWGFKKDKDMARVAAKYEVPCCIMHNRENRNYNNFIDDMMEDLRESINIAKEAGVKDENIILDPGIGFAKDQRENLMAMKYLGKLNDLGYPWLLGTSRKSMIGNALDLPKGERLEGTLATTAIGIVKGCDFVRIHDVLENKRVAIMTDAIERLK